MNKSLKHPLVIQGSGGGGKGGGSTRSPQEAPNTLRSKMRAQIVDIIGEGEIEGPAIANDWYRSTFLSGTPVHDASGNENFPGIVLFPRVGTPDQDYIEGFSSAETTVGVGAAVENGTPIIRRITDTDADAVRCILTIPALNNLDSETGDLDGHSVTVEIWVTAQADQGGATAVRKVADTITGKCTAPYARAYRIALEGGAPYDIEFRRTSTNSQDSTIQDTTTWTSYTEIVEAKLIHPNTALVGIDVDAELFGQRIPSRGYEIKGLKIQIPSNMDGTARTFTGTWDGTFKTEWTDDPAWILNDLVTNDRYGLGDVFAQADIDKWDLYQLSVYNSASVDNGRGGTEPRFSFNGVISTREDAMALLDAVAGVMRASMLWTGTQLGFTQNKPTSTTRQFSPANVVKGEFNYSGTSLTARHTVAHVTWFNPDKEYRRDVMVIEDKDAVARYGYNILEITAFGCTSPSQAYRHGLAAILTERLETDVVQFKVGLENADMRPGEIAEIYDPMFTTQSQAGRLKAVNSTTEVQLDREYTFDASETYTLTVITGAGELSEHAVTNPGNTTTDTITLSAALDSNDLPVVNGMWGLSTGTLEPRKFRVMLVKEQEKNEFAVAAVEYDESKFTAIDNGVLLPDDSSDWSDLPDPSTVAAPTTPSAALETVDTPGGARLKLTLDWTESPDSYLKGYKVFHQAGDDNWEALPLTELQAIAIPDPTITVHRFMIHAVNEHGQVSVGVPYDIDLTTGGANGKDLVSDLEIIGGGTAWTGKDIFLGWTADAPQVAASLRDNAKDPYFRRYRIRVVNPSGGATILTLNAEENHVVVPYEKLEDAGVLRRDYQIFVSVEDILGDFSNEASITVANAAPALPTFTATQHFREIQIDFDDPTDADYVGVIVWMSTSSGVTETEGNVVWRGQGNPRIPVLTGQTYYWKAAAYDAFGETALNVSTEGNLTVDQIGNSDIGAGVVAIDRLVQTAQDRINAVPGIQTDVSTLQTDLDAAESELDTAERLLNSTAWGAIVANMEPIHPDLQWTGGTELSALLTSGGSRATESTVNGELQLVTNATGSQYLYIDNLVANGLPAEVAGDLSYADARYLVMEFTPTVDAGNDFTTYLRAAFRTNNSDSASWFDPVTGSKVDALEVGRRYTIVWDLFGQTSGSGHVWGSAAPDRIWFEWQDGNAVGNTAIIHKVALMSSGDVMTAYSRARITDNETLTADHATRITTLEASDSTNTSAISTLQTVQADHATRIGTLETSSADYGSRITTVESTTASQATSITNLETTAAWVADGAIPAGHGHVGMTGDLTFEINELTTGPNDGELKVTGSYYEHPTAGRRTTNSTFDINTPYEGNTAGMAVRAYLICSNVACATRFSGWDGVTSGGGEFFFLAVYYESSGQWTAFGNTSSHSYSPRVSDVVVAVLTKPNTSSGGIDTLSSLVTQTGDLDGRVDTAESSITTLNTTTSSHASRLTNVETSIGTDDAQGTLFSRIATQETTTDGHASRLSLVEVGQYEQVRTGLAMNAVDQRIVMDDYDIVDIVAMEDNVTVYQNGAVLTTLTNRGDVYSLTTGNQTKGDILTSDKPTAMYDRAGYPLPHLGFKGRQFIAKQTRAANIELNIYSEEDAFALIYVRNNTNSDAHPNPDRVPTPTADLSAGLTGGAVTTITLDAATYGFSDGDNVSVYIQASTDVVVMCRDGDGSDDHGIVPPVSRRVLNARTNEFNPFDSVATWTNNSSNATANGDVYYFYDSDVPGSTYEVGDGSGSANAHGLPYEALGDTYIIPANTALEVTVVAVEPCIVDVVNLSNTIQQTLDFTSASFTNPVAISIDEQSSSTKPWSGQAVTLKSRDGTPFGVRMDDLDADEMWLLGYRESLQQNFIGGRVGVVEKVTKDNASRLTTVETTAGSNSSAITTLQSTTSTNASAISTIQTSIGTDDAQGSLFSRIATQETTTAGHATRLSTTEIQITGALPLLPQGGNLAQDASHWYMPTTNDSSGTFTGADLDAHSNMTAATVGTATAGSDTGTGLQGYDGRWMFTRYAIPVDTGRRYRMRVKVLFPSGVGGNFYAGLATLDGSYNAITGGAGTHRYFVGSFSQSSNAGTIATFEGEITGEGSLATEFRPGTQYVRPMIITSYSTSASAQPIVLSIDFQDVTEEVDIGARTAIVEEALWDGSETRARIMFLADAGTGAVAAGWLTSSANPDGVVQSEVGWAADKFLVYNSETATNDPVFAIDTEGNKVRIRGDLVADGSIEGTAIKAGSLVQVGTGTVISGTSIYDRAAMAGHDNGDYRFWAGGLSGSGANFSVDREGSIVARKITILSEDGTTVWFDSVNGFSAVAIAQINANTATRVASVIGTPANNTTHTDFSLTDDPSSTNVRMKASVSSAGLSVTQTWLYGNSEPSNAFPSTLTIVIKYRDKDVGGAYTTGVTQNLTKITSGTPTSSQYKVTTTTQAPFYEPDLELGGQPINIPGWKTETITEPSALVAEFTQSLAGDSDGRTWEVLVELTPTGGVLNFETKTRTLTVDTTDGGKPFVILDNGSVPGDGNADTLDGFNSSDFGRLASAQTWTQENTFNAKAYFGDGLIVSGPGSYSASNDTRTDVGIVLPSGAAIHGEDAGYLRYLFEWNANNKIVIGQTGTSMITGVSLQGGNAGGVDMYHAGVKQWETISNGFQFGDVSTRTSITSSGSGVVLNHTDNSDIFIRTQGNNRLVYDHSANWWQLTNNAGLRMSGNSARVKIGVWTNTDTYGMGMQSGMTHGYLNDYAMTFAMNNDTDRGFWWGHNGHANSAGAMSLTTDGRLWLHQSLTVSGAWGATSGVTAAKFRPVDYATGKPELNIKKTSTANQWNIELWDGVDQSGVINFGSTSLQHQGDEIATQAWVNSQIGGTVTTGGTNIFTGSNTFNSGILIGSATLSDDHRIVSWNDGGNGTLIISHRNTSWDTSLRLTDTTAQIYADGVLYQFNSSGLDLGQKDIYDVRRLQVGNGDTAVNANAWFYVYGRESQNENAHKYGFYARLDIEGNVSNFSTDRTRAAVYGYTLLEDNSTTADSTVATPIGVYGYANAVQGHADAMYGVYGLAINSGGSDTDVAAIYGGTFEARIDNAGSTSGTLYGVRGAVRLTDDADDSITANGVHGFLNADGGTIGTGRMLYGSADVEAGATVTTLYGLHLDMQNSVGTVTNRRGIWLEGNTTYLTNSIGGRSYFGNAEGFVNPDSPYVVHMENEQNVLVALIQGPSDGSGVYTRYSRGTSYVWDIGLDSGSDFLFRANGTTTSLRLNYDMLEAAFNSSGLSFDNKQALTGTDSWLRLNGNSQFTSGVYFGSSLVRTDGTFNISNVVTLDDGAGSSLRVSNASGYVDIGPQNTTWCHFSTDRSKFYFNKHLEAVTRVGVYNTLTYMENGLMRVENSGANRARLWAHGAGSGYTTADILLEDDSGSTVRGMGMFLYNRSSGKEWFFGQPYNGDETYSGVCYSYQANGSEGGETASYTNLIVGFYNNGQVRFQGGSAATPSIAFMDNSDCGFYLNGNETRVVSDGNNVMGWTSGRIEVYNNAYIDFNAHSGERDLMHLEGRQIMRQMSDRGALLLRSADDSLCLFAGDTHTNMTANVSVTAENMYFGADGNFQWYGNMQNGWANRYTMTFSGGNLTVSGNVTQQSDARLKHSIRDWEIDVDRVIENIRPREYGWNNPYKAQNDFGLIAQELQEVLPGAVKEDDEGYLAVDYSRLSVVALAAVKRDRERISELEDRLDRLEELLEAA